MHGLDCSRIEPGENLLGPRWRLYQPPLDDLLGHAAFNELLEPVI